MARPREQQDRLKKRPVPTRFTEAQLRVIDERAERASMKRAHFIRAMALYGKVTVQHGDAVDFQLINELKRVGNNLNQIAYHANLHDGEILPELAHTLAELNTLFDRIAERI